MKEEIAGFYVVIPMEIVFDESLSPKARLLYGVIANLSSKKGYCYATNIYLSKLTQWHRDTVSEFVNQLIDKDYVIREDVPNAKGIERRLKIGGVRPFDRDGELGQKSTGVRPSDRKGLGETALHEETNLLIKGKSKADQVFEYFANARMKYGFTGRLIASKQRMNSIRNRVKEFSFEDCICVIDYKFQEWNGNAEMRKFLTPDTIFRPSNFPKYVEAYKNAPVKDWTDQKSITKPFPRGADEINNNNLWPG